MKATFGVLLCFVLFLCRIMVMSSPIGYLIWGTPFLYQSEKFEVNPRADKEKGPDYQKRFGYRGEHLVANLNQTVVETNKKLFDVEDSTKSYKSPLSHW